MLSLNVTLTDSETGSTAEIELDDQDAQIGFPNIGDDVNILLGWEGFGGIADVFTGVIDEIRCVGSRQSGAVMRISAKSVDTINKAKQHGEKHVDKKKLKDAAKELSKDSDIDEVRVDDELAKIERDWWALQNESFIHWGTRIAKEIGANFQVNGKTASFTKAKGGKSASGKQLTPITATYGVNMMSWEISPILGRPQFHETQALYFDVDNAEYKKASKKTKSKKSKATHTARKIQYDWDTADGQAQNDADSSDKNSGEGNVNIDGDQMAQPGATCEIVGIRPGIDGSYLITSVSHTLSRGAGYMTSLELKQPGQNTGSETRSG